MNSQGCLAASLIVTGSTLSLVGIVGAWMACKADFARARKRVETMKRLEAERTELSADILARAKELSSQRGVNSAVVYEELKVQDAEGLRAAYAADDLTLPTYANVTQLALIEVERFAHSLLSSNKSNAVLLSVGLVLSAVGSVWSIWL